MNNADVIYSVFRSAANESSISPNPYCICVMIKHIVNDMTIKMVTNFSLASNEIIIIINGLKCFFEFVFLILTKIRH